MGRFSRFAAFLRLFNRFVNRADKEEGAFRQVIMLALDDFTEAAQGFAQRDVHTGKAGELLTDVEGLNMSI